MTAAVGAIGAEERTYRLDIDGLRAISILLVVAFHAGWPLFSGGYIGVDVFFVLSGYLITGLLLDEHARTGRIGLRDFYARRVRRLLPLSAVVLLSTLALGLLILPPLSRGQLIEDARAAALYFANWRYGAQATAYSDAEVTDALLLHYWSLSVEEQFYFLWPILIVLSAVFARKVSGVPFRRALGAVLGTVIGLSFLSSLVLTPRLGPGAYYATHTRLWEIGLGAALALALPSGRRSSRIAAESMSAIGLGAIVLAAVAYGPSTAFPGWAASVPVAGTLMVIAGASGKATTMVSRALSAGPMPRVGRWSYGWYLWHWPAIGAGHLLNDRAGQRWDSWQVTAAAVVLSFGLAALSHVLIENPVRYAPILRRTGRSLALGLALTCAPIMAGFAYISLGDIGNRPAPPHLAAVGDPSAPPVGGMTPLEASQDHVAVGSPTCHADQETTTADLSCVFGAAKAERTVLLIGDSHARHWLPALDEAAREHGWRLISATKSACNPFEVPAWNSNFERPYVECAAWRDSLIQQLQVRGGVDLVIVGRSMGHRSAVYVDGARVQRSAIGAVWREGASRTFEALRAVAEEVVVLRDTPWAPEDVPTCLSEVWPEVGACAFALPGEGGDDLELYQAESAVAPDGVSFVSVTDLVCPEDPCQMVTEDGVIKYRDRHHLTATFSRSLAERLAKLTHLTDAR